MAGDVLAVLDGWGIEQADVMGMSLGGYIAQVVAVLAPERVRSLTLFASEPLGWDGDTLPSISDSFMTHFGKLAALDWQDREAVIETLLQSEILCAVDPSHIDARAGRDRIAESLVRSASPQSAFNHGMVSLAGDWTGAARRITCPTLVLHETIDPILPLPNGEALATMIPGARLVVLEGLGHSIPDRYIPDITARIGAFLADLPSASAAGNQ
jgi:pimeloyl-ACP methyl ester carboxylesterase